MKKYFRHIIRGVILLFLLIFVGVLGYKSTLYSKSNMETIRKDSNSIITDRNPINFENKNNNFYYQVDVENIYLAKLDDKKDIVTTIQEKLSQLNYTVSVNGVFDKETQDAVIKFERDNNLPQDGKVNQLTLDTIDDMINLKDTNDKSSDTPNYIVLEDSKDTTDTTKQDSGYIVLEDSKEVVLEATNDIIYDKPLFSAKTQNKVVSITFDDGPDNKLTPQLLDILKKENVQVAFFCLGNQIDNNKDIIKREDEEGHLVLNHSLSHPQLNKLNSSQLTVEVTSTEDKIYNIIGKKPAIIRPPYGAFNQQTISTLTSLGYNTVLWSIDTLDWKNKNKDIILQNVFNELSPGDVILMHMNQGKEASLAAIPELIQGLKERGYEIQRLDKMLDIKPYK